MTLLQKMITCDDVLFLHELSKELLQYFELTNNQKIIEKVKRRLSKDEWLRLREIITTYELPVAIFMNGLFGGYISLNVFIPDYQNDLVNFKLEVYFENMPIVDDDFMLLDERGRMQNAYFSWSELLNSESNKALIKKYNLPPTREFEWYLDWD